MLPDAPAAQQASGDPRRTLHVTFHGRCGDAAVWRAAMRDLIPGGAALRRLMRHDRGRTGRRNDFIRGGGRGWQRQTTTATGKELRTCVTELEERSRASPPAQPRRFERPGRRLGRHGTSGRPWRCTRSRATRSAPAARRKPKVVGLCRALCQTNRQTVLDRSVR